ncbi:hypothetical protein L1887_23808 [Cichorium endivia]|nr:hypothetical protein L1887_23808 [Cichorium endivia]
MSVIASFAAPPQTCFLGSSIIPTPFAFSVKDDTSGADLAQPNPTSSIPAHSPILRSLARLMHHNSFGDKSSTTGIVNAPSDGALLLYMLV